VKYTRKFKVLNWPIKVDISEIKSGNVNYNHAATGELRKGAGGGNHAMRASNYKMTMYKNISLSQCV
jgi:hypothetical protein